jgi:Glu-tRNA(Gln) amidotransferase subunit E-like FAD-binding protein
VTNGLEETLTARIREIAREEIASVQAGRRWADVDGVASYLRTSTRRVRGYREAGLPARKLGKRLLFDLDEVDDWLDREGR